jgi:hypothetical protein
MNTIQYVLLTRHVLTEQEGSMKHGIQLRIFTGSNYGYMNTHISVI